MHHAAWCPVCCADGLFGPPEAPYCSLLLANCSRPRSVAPCITATGQPGPALSLTQYLSRCPCRPTPFPTPVQLPALLLRLQRTLLGGGHTRRRCGKGGERWGGGMRVGRGAVGRGAVGRGHACGQPRAVAPGWWLVVPGWSLGATRPRHPPPTTLTAAHAHSSSCSLATVPPHARSALARQDLLFTYESAPM